MKKDIKKPLPFMKGMVFVNHFGPSKKFKTVGNSFVCIIPTSVKEGDSCITVNDETHLLEKDIPFYLEPTDIFYFSGAVTLTMTFSSAFSHFSEEQEMYEAIVE